jgi:hypothetical protein|nr:co-chaperone protein p23-1-like [Lolium perenne]
MANYLKSMGGMGRGMGGGMGGMGGINAMGGMGGFGGMNAMGGMGGFGLYGGMMNAPTSEIGGIGGYGEGMGAPSGGFMASMNPPSSDQTIIQESNDEEGQNGDGHEDEDVEK